MHVLVCQFTVYTCIVNQITAFRVKTILNICNTEPFLTALLSEKNIQI